MLSEYTLLMTQSADAENPGLFPFPFTMHVVFCAIALVFFLFRFSSDKKPYQLIFAIAVPFSLLLWISSSRTLFYIVGAAELIFVLAALLTSVFCKPKTAAETAANTETAESAEAAVAEPEKQENSGEQEE
ncbi:MAG: hypothetical protein IJ874_01480 [Ruminococcus sp.]|nr:hypothetical protein [Ruminococcus sp.]